MSSMLMLALALMLAATTAAAPPSVHLPITSRAELKAYLRDTPSAVSPLRWFTPGARKRFLAELRFGPRGLASTPLDDAEQQLTHPQIVKLFNLFGVRYAAQGLGLTPAEQARRQQERRAAAKVRGCTSVAACPESTIERRYDQLMLRRPDASLPQAQRAAATVRHYDHLFSRYQKPSRLQSISDPDLRFLKRAVETAVFWSPDSKHIRQLRDDLAAMHRRGMTDDHDFASLYRALVAARQFVSAGQLERKHPHMDVTTLPTWHPPAKLPANQPTALSVSANGQTMTREAFQLDAPLRIVIVASCHFSQDAARAIKKHRQLRALFAKHAIWLADQSDSIAAAKQWNKEFPEQPIHIAWRNSEWAMLDSWAMPTFYVFRHGKLIDQWAGWPAGSSALATLQRHLQRDGILPK